MLRANVGVSRKISENFNSSGFSLNLEAEILATVDDPEAVIERIKELYDLAEEALDRKVSEARELDAFARRDAGPEPDHGQHGRVNGRRHADEEPPTHNGSHGGGEPATNKQVQFLQNLAKRQKLFGPKLEAFIEEVLGKACSPYDLTKKEAGAVIDALNPESADAKKSRR